MTSPPRDSLTNWFLDAKRSLGSVSLCTRAHVLVDSARAALQEASIVSSRCVFLRAALQEQLTIADQINRMVHTAKDAAREEFEVCFASVGRDRVSLGDGGESNASLDQIRCDFSHPYRLVYICGRRVEETRWNGLGRRGCRGDGINANTSCVLAL